ncbi:MAG: hypothetical protein M1833_006339 [Piccolia ochrophora]|nr:MAG: hypothetical protein M1833_006339 [Piccolia ochrophora]
MGEKRSSRSEGEVPLLADEPSLDDQHDHYQNSSEDENTGNEEFEPLYYDEGPISHENEKTRRSRFLVEGWRKWLLILSIILAGFVAIISAGGLWVYKVAPKDGQSPPWYPTPRGGTSRSWQDSYSKAQKMVNQMSLIEKVNVTTGTGWMSNLCVGNTGPAIGVKFPSLCLQDGPLGIRFADRITQFPAGITTGATWDKVLMKERGRALGLEAKRKGIHVLLAPVVGPLGKLPAGGRIWEGFGADPVLQGIAAAETVKGIQEQGVIASGK